MKRQETDVKELVQGRQVNPRLRLAMFRYVFLLIVCTISSLCSAQEIIENIDFDKEKWKVSSDYRYEILRSKDFPLIEGKSKKQIRKLLGSPDFIIEDKFVYCLDIPSSGNNKCLGSRLIIGFEKRNPYNVVVLWVDPSSLVPFPKRK